jgi:hypothetical protein
MSEFVICIDDAPSDGPAPDAYLYSASMFARWEWPALRREVARQSIHGERNAVPAIDEL